MTIEILNIETRKFSFYYIYIERMYVWVHMYLDIKSFTSKIENKCSL